jgi:hypothetical protein
MKASVGSRITSAKSTLFRRTGVLAVIAAIAALAVSAAPAGATLKFCKASVCIGQPNGCNVRTSDGVVIMAADGDSFVDIHGRTWTCKRGTFTVSYVYSSR